MLIVVDPDWYLLNVQRTLVTLIGHAAAVTFGASVRIVRGQSKGGGTATVALGSFDVSFAIASVADAQAAARASLVTATRCRVFVNAVLRRSSCRVPFVSWLANLAEISGGMVCAILQYNK